MRCVPVGRDSGPGDWPHGWQMRATRILNTHFRERTLLLGWTSVQQMVDQILNIVKLVHGYVDDCNQVQMLKPSGRTFAMCASLLLLGSGAEQRRSRRALQSNAEQVVVPSRTSASLLVHPLEGFQAPHETRAMKLTTSGVWCEEMHWFGIVGSLAIPPRFLNDQKRQRSRPKKPPQQRPELRRAPQGKALQRGELQDGSSVATL